MDPGAAAQELHSDRAPHERAAFLSCQLAPRAGYPRVIAAIGYTVRGTERLTDRTFFSCRKAMYRLA